MLAQNIEAVQGLQRHSPVQLREFHAQAGTPTLAGFGDIRDARCAIGDGNRVGRHHAVMIDSRGLQVGDLVCDGHGGIAGNHGNAPGNDGSSGTGCDFGSCAILCNNRSCPLGMGCAPNQPVIDPMAIEPELSGTQSRILETCHNRIMLGGDLIVAIDGQKVEDENDLSQMMNNHRAGDTIKVTVYRNKKKMDINVSLGEARQQV